MTQQACGGRYWMHLGKLFFFLLEKIKDVMADQRCERQRPPNAFHGPFHRREYIHWQHRAIFYQNDISEWAWHLISDTLWHTHARTLFKNHLHTAQCKTCKIPPANVWLSRQAQSSCAVWQKKKVWPFSNLPAAPLYPPHPAPSHPHASTCSPGDRYYLHGRGSAVNAMSKAPGRWQAKTKCLEIEM